MNETSGIDFCQTSGKMLAELGFELTTPGLRASFANDWTTGFAAYIRLNPFPTADDFENIVTKT